VSKTEQFRQLLHSEALEFLIEAHNGMSAKIGEEAGFKGLWASGLCISGQLAVRDSNEASWTQVLDVLEFMADATSIPILLDGDTGYGNFNSMRRLVRKLEQRDVAAVCIEDKLFPKTNSFIGGETQPLADIDEFCGKIKAGKDAQSDPDFAIVARVEAFIAGWGLGEALTRAHAYADAGADAILMHSAKSTPDEILAFTNEWHRDCPVIIVPTRYYSTPSDVYRSAGVSVVIWANHLLRAAIGAMQQTAATIKAEENLFSVEDQVVPVAEIFRLQGAPELAEAEKRYLPNRNAGVRTVVLAASRGEELGELTSNRPKAMVEVNGRPLAQHIVDAFNAIGVKNITLVRGFGKDSFDIPNLHYVDNDDFEQSGELASLQVALDALPAESADATLIVCYGDVLFSKFVPQALLDLEADLAIAVDTDWRVSANRNRAADLVRCSSPPSRDAFYKRINLERISTELPEDEVHGEWMGFLKIGPDAQALVRELTAELLSAPDGRQAALVDLLQALASSHRAVEVFYTTGHWLDVDRLADLGSAGSFEAPGDIK
jgi:phosphoenolpyruvate phosphomutase